MSAGTPAKLWDGQAATPAYADAHVAVKQGEAGLAPDLERQQRNEQVRAGDRDCAGGCEQTDSDDDRD
jgi:hypothetical protein